MGKGVHDTILNARSEELRNLKFTMALATLNDETRQALAAAAENGQKSPFEKLTPDVAQYLLEKAINEQFGSFMTLEEIALTICSIIDEGDFTVTELADMPNYRFIYVIQDFFAKQIEYDFGASTEGAKHDPDIPIILNAVAGKTAKVKGHATYPDDFPRLAQYPGRSFYAWFDGQWNVESTLEGDVLREELQKLRKTGSFC